MNVQKNKKMILITGAGRGIGEAIARKYIDSGCDVILNYRKSSGKGAANIQKLRALAEKRGVRGIPALGDISDPHDVERMFKTFVQEHDITSINHLILNAAATPFKSFIEMTRNDWKVLLGTNLIGNVACVSQAVTLMPPGSSICALSSLGSLKPLPRYPLGVLKAALEQLIRYLDVELSSKGIRANAVCAGFVNTDMLSILKEKWPEIFTHLEESNRRYILEPEEVAEVVAFLTSDAASAICGEIVVADAGVSICT